MFRAACESCGFRAKAKRADRLPDCPKCGGVLAAVESAPDAVPGPPEQRCQACGAENPGSARFCESCGAPLREDVEPRTTSIDKHKQRREARERKQALGALRLVRFYFVGMAALIGLRLLIVFLLLRGEVADPIVPMVMLVLGGLLGFCVLAAVFIQKAPFVLALTLSCLLTLLMILTVLAGAFPGVFDILITIGSWGATAKLTRLRHLLAVEPEAQRERRERRAALRKSLRANRRSEHGELTSRMKKRTSEKRKSALIWAAACVAILLGIVVVGKLAGGNGRQAVHARELPKSPPYKPFVTRFEAAWSRSDQDAILSFFPPGTREFAGDRFAKRLAARGIGAELPALTDYNEILIPRENPQKVKAYWSIPSARIRTEWHHENGTWLLYRLTFHRPR